MKKDIEKYRHDLIKIFRGADIPSDSDAPEWYANMVIKIMKEYAEQFKTTIVFKLDKEQIDGIVCEVHGRNCPNCGCQL